MTTGVGTASAMIEDTGTFVGLATQRYWGRLGQSLMSSTNRALLGQDAGNLPISDEEVVRRVSGKFVERALFVPLMWLGNSDHHLLHRRVPPLLQDQHSRSRCRAPARASNCSGNPKFEYRNSKQIRMIETARKRAQIVLRILSFVL